MTRSFTHPSRSFAFGSLLCALAAPPAAPAPEPPLAPVRFYVAVAPLADASGAGREDADELARGFLMEELQRLPEVEVHAVVPAPDDFRDVLRRRDLQGLVLQGSVVELARSRGAVTASLSVIVLDPGQSFRALLRGDGDAVGTAGALDETDIPAAQTDALRAAARAAADGFARYLERL